MAFLFTHSILPEEKSSRAENACHSVIKGTFVRKSPFYSLAMSVLVQYLNIKAFNIGNHGKLNFVGGSLLPCIRFSVEIPAGVAIDLLGHFVVEWIFAGLEAGLKVHGDRFLVEAAIGCENRWG